MGPGLKSRFKYLPFKRTDPDQSPSLSAGPENAGFIAYRASAQTGARTRTPIACEASSHFGTRTREMLLTKLVLISAAGRLEGECSVWYVSDGCLVQVSV
ncbi:hypothetical protein DPMN_015285 [Dreissena polymorpha]|uniref:Uncharacterized protein n=1 Tax=Dreissena polymorpha TaxID=45954 RepID=A0A9D4S5C3_DREPO|nr:hypothetical protein DPMN_015285 [Dreissena polymorpha]